MSEFLNYLTKLFNYPNYKILNYMDINLFYIDEWIIKINNKTNMIILLNSFGQSIKEWKNIEENWNNIISEIQNEINIKK